MVSGQNANDKLQLPKPEYKKGLPQPQNPKHINQWYFIHGVLSVDQSVSSIKGMVLQQLYYQSCSVLCCSVLFFSPTGFEISSI